MSMPNDPLPRTLRALGRALLVLPMLLAGWSNVAVAHDPASAAVDLPGAWKGVLGPDIIDLEIRVVFDGSPEALTGTIDIPAQGLIGFALGDIALDGNTVRFVMPGVPGDPTFEGTVAGGTIEGTFQQGGQALPFVLTHVEDASASLRPQEPQPPFPYVVEDVRYASGDVVLAGTLTLPQGTGPFPAALLIPGSGAHDRNEELLGHRPFLLLADQLTRAGVAVLRVDDRGVGGSTGSDSQASYEHLQADTLAGVAYLASRAEIDRERIGLIGHSQGGYLAPAAAVASDDVAFVVMIAGPAVSGAEVLLRQNELLIRNALAAVVPTPDEADVQARIDEQFAFLNTLIPLLEQELYAEARELVREEVEAAVAAAPADQRPTPAEVEQLIKAQSDGIATPVMRAFLIFDPQPYLRQLTLPLLALYGDLDVQVDAEQSVGPLREALAAAGNTDVTIVTLPGLNHLMQPATTGMPDEYGSIEVTIDPVALETITSWVVERFVHD